MIRSVIVAVGGTGQLVLHYYAQLFQIGALADSFHAIVVDSDALMPSLEKFSSFWNKARIAHPDPMRVPHLDYFSVAQNLRGQVMQAVVGTDLSTQRKPHPAEALFDSISLKQGVKEGLYARPALSAVLQTDWAKFPLSSLTGFQRVLVVGSIIGGTGGGLIAPLLSQLATRINAAVATPQPRMRAIFFGEYFELQGNSPVTDASLRYPSNKLFVGRCLKELAPPELEHFAFIEPSTPKPRVLSDERNPAHLSWPAQADAIWVGLSALEELRLNTTWPNAKEFQGKEKAGLPPRDIGKDSTALAHSLGVAQTLANLSVLERIPKEPWMVRFYGRELPRLMAKAYSIARGSPALNIRGTRMLGRLLQTQYAAQWNELGSVFPRIEGSEASPATLRRVKWGDLKSEVTSLASSREALLNNTSALLLHSALRGGEA